MNKSHQKPHSQDLRKHRYSKPGQVYHITTTTLSRRAVFKEIYLGREVVKCLYHPERDASTLAYVVMPDHMHWLMQLGEQRSLSSEVQQMKRVSSMHVNRLNGRSGSIWQTGYHDHAVRKDEDLVRIARYIITNPIRAGLVKRIEDYSLWNAIWV
jgi:REP element-mobilizing transposase RayT